VPLTSDGIMPFYRYVIRQRGRIEVGSQSCATCHLRVMDGVAVAGPPGNFPFERMHAYLLRENARFYGEAAVLASHREGVKLRHATPGIAADPLSRLSTMSLDEMIGAYQRMPAGVMARTNASPIFPVAVPDLIGVRERRYLDRTATMCQREIGDLMRYAAVVQGDSELRRFGNHDDRATLPDPARLGRYSDTQLYALARFLYHLQPPDNPYRDDPRAEFGREIFQREECWRCHSAPHYTNNQVIPVEGWLPTQHDQRFDVAFDSLETDPGLALSTRKGTGYYKVPSLRGLWYRGVLGHNGAVVALADWLDPRRTEHDYLPTGFGGYAEREHGVRGHPFGLSLSPQEKEALIAFLRTL
jgi:hypothetical protein